LNGDDIEDDIEDDTAFVPSCGSNDEVMETPSIHHDSSQSHIPHFRFFAVYRNKAPSLSFNSPPILLSDTTATPQQALSLIFHLAIMAKGKSSKSSASSKQKKIVVTD
jgi:hypothetical protein